MRVVILTRNNAGIASRFLRREMPAGVEVVGVIQDTGAPISRLAQYKRQARKVRRLGPSVAPVAFVLRRAYRRADAASVPELENFDVRLARVPNPNLPEAHRRLAEFEPDLLLTLGSRFLIPTTFAIPSLGAINVHHGSVPLYRGGPPIFWELVDGVDEVGYVVHQIDAGIDTGPVFAAGSVAIQYRASVAETILATLPPLYEQSLDALGDVLGALAAGRAVAHPQGTTGGRLNTSPRLRDYRRAAATLRPTG
jgi:methionyl-tRNA formyltransferase